MCVSYPPDLKKVNAGQKANIKLLQWLKQSKKLNLYFPMNGSNYSKEQTKIKKLVMLGAILDIWGAIKTDMGYQVNKQVLC